ncbi:MAG: FHA domain-containing protein [Magnetococcales bacterium]|nr:FHA domain-containing protein [Magnetococcales bacterium]
MQNGMTGDKNMAVFSLAKFFQQAQATTNLKSDRDRPIPDIQKAMLDSGRIEFAQLATWVGTYEKKQFVSMFPMPFLAGSSVVQGVLSTLSHQEITKLFEEKRDAVRVNQNERGLLEWAVYPLVKKKGTFGTGIDKFLIGRTSESDIVIPDYAISKKHAEIRMVHKKCYIKDSGARNKTSINNALLEKNIERPLKDGDMLKFGRYKFYFKDSQGIYELLNPEF